MYSSFNHSHSVCEKRVEKRGEERREERKLKISAISHPGESEWRMISFVSGAHWTQSHPVCLQLCQCEIFCTIPLDHRTVTLYAHSVAAAKYSPLLLTVFSLYFFILIFFVFFFFFLFFLQFRDVQFAWKFDRQVMRFAREVITHKSGLCRSVINSRDTIFTPVTCVYCGMHSCLLSLFFLFSTSCVSVDARFVHLKMYKQLLRRS